MSCAIVGAGLVEVEVTVNCCVFEVVPATLELATAIGNDPDVVRRLAGNTAVSEVGSVYDVDKDELPNVA
jgi:hypothetical protein